MVIMMVVFPQQPSQLRVVVRSAMNALDASLTSLIFLTSSPHPAAIAILKEKEGGKGAFAASRGGDQGQYFLLW